MNESMNKPLTAQQINLPKIGNDHETAKIKNKNK